MNYNQEDTEVVLCNLHMQQAEPYTLLGNMRLGILVYKTSLRNLADIQ